ncbi:MAG: rRNA pseudouridine synthase [Xanthomonadales bacterium]|nr:rRNA pseudouridine synthase [Xanthomonadales bacterium]MCB1634950.1 rRNA pseudouridine synthase [Xanthomonadales bacterium]
MRSPSGSRRVGLARRLSKLGYCSRSQAEALIRAGRVSLNGAVQRDPEQPTAERDRITVDGQAIGAAQRRYLLLNKPRGLTTSTADERGRDTVYACLLPEQAWPAPASADQALPWLAPVGRLDRASEGLLLFSNDPEWAASITDGDIRKVYHVRIEQPADAALLEQLRVGVVDQGERLRCIDAALLRANAEGRSRWLALTLDEGRNRHIRRLLLAHGLTVQRLLRVRVGRLELGDLPKGQWRWIDPGEV